MDPTLASRRAALSTRVIGRAHELDLVLAAVSAGRDLLLEGPPGTSKSTILWAITENWGIPLLFVEGNAELTPAKLVGHHNPAREGQGDDRRAVRRLSCQGSGRRRTAAREELGSVVAEEIGETRAAGGEEGGR